MATSTRRSSNPVIDREDIAQLEAGTGMLVQYLQEAHATEGALVTTLGAHIAITPRGSYRQTLERHLTETRQHARALERRISELGGGSGLLGSAYGAVQNIVAQAFVLTKGPLDMLRGSTGEEKLLKNAKDEATSEMLEIATYDAIEELAKAIGDEKTARLAARHREQEERALSELRGHIVKLAQATVEARAGGKPSYDWETTGAAEAAKGVASAAEDTAERAAGRTQRTAKRAAGTARGAAKGTASTAKSAAKGTRSTAKRTARSTAASAKSTRSTPKLTAKPAQPPFADYDSLAASEVVAKLTDLTQDELSRVISYERTDKKRDTVLDRAKALQENEPFAGFDDLTARDVAARLRDADEKTVSAARAYESRHKRRVEVLEAAQRQLSSTD